MVQVISEPTQAEAQWIEGNLSLAREIANVYGVQGGDTLSPVTLDAIWTAWLQEHRRGEEDPNPFINAFGIALGQYLVNRLGLSWRVVEDEYGTELAVYREANDVLVFPPNLVGKRYAQGEAGFFVPLAAWIEERVTSLPS